MVMIAFISMVFLCIFWFIESALETIDGVSNGLDKIVFDKGAFYLLGAAIGLVDLIWIMTYQGILKKALNSKVTIIFSRVAAASLVVAFTLPVVCHLFIEQTVFNMDYEECTAESNTWLYLSEIVYTNDKEACTD